MLDGTTLEELKAQAEALKLLIKERGFEEVDDLLSDRDKIAEERDTFAERHKNAEKLIQRQGAELGDLRKKAGVSVKTTENTEQDPEPETLKQIEDSLTDEQWKVVDAVYGTLPDAQPNEQGLSKKLAVEDQKVRIALLKQVRDSVEVVPKSLRPGQGAAQRTDDVEDRVKSLFDSLKGKEGFPIGSLGTSSVSTHTQKPRTVRVVDGGLLAAAKEMA